MTTIVTRAGKGTPLLNTEVDANFTNLNRDKLEVGGDFQSGTANSLVTLNDSKVLTTTNSVNDFGLNAIAQALHRSPSAITAMFIYDTSKDSDGGAWTEKCQHTSWYNEEIYGRWLGEQTSETLARNANAVLGSQLVTNGTFDTDTTGWTATSGVLTVESGWLRNTSSAAPSWASTLVTLVVGKTYRMSGTWRSSAGTWRILIGTTPGGSDINIVTSAAGSGAYDIFLTATTSVVYISIRSVTITTGDFVEIDNISVREVTATTTQANDYFQLTTDGRFYRLNKNLLTSTATLATQTQFLTAGTYTFSSTTASSGSVAISGAATASHTAGGAATTFTVATSGNVTFTVTGSVTTAQCELGSTATTYEASGATRITEVFRGNKRDFPRLAGIVAEASSVNIYDLTEPGRPLWMRIGSGNTETGIGGAASTLSCVSANNGRVIWGGSTNGDLQICDFPRDGIARVANSTPGVFRGTIAQRQLALSFTYSGNWIASGAIASRNLNAVAMTVLPTAPRDPVTGLAVPTIGIATAGGISIIQDSGTVRNSSSTLAFTSLSLTPQLLTVGRADTTFYYAANPGLLGASFTLTTRTNVQAPDFNIGNTNGLIAPMRSELLRRSATAATVQKLKNFEADPAKALAATITNLFTTGHQPGDIKRTYLADIGEGSVTGPELVTNGTFDSDVAGWSGANNGTVSWNSGAIRGTVVQGNFGGVQPLPAITPVDGKTYVVSFNIIARSSTQTGRMSFGGVTFSLLPLGVSTFIISAVSTANLVLFSSSTTGGAWMEWDNISVREVVADRSYKAQGAEIYNSVTKTAVATGSQLVAYSNFTDLATDFDVLAVGNDRLFVGSSPLVLQAL
jgi:hypothetical protein